MSARTIKPQVLEHDGEPMFVVLPWIEYKRLTEKEDDRVRIPLDVAEIATMEDKSLIRAWREHLNFTQGEVASRIGVSRAAFAQMEAKGGKPRRATLTKIAQALGVKVEQLAE
ncbi:MAG: helix-turn-helix transcriptional regulator [Desulfovibrionaceae bacterium]|nr:helix-turn-helix transcriptional regulator [Desulfovibrionaceae bacterium]MBF0514560.1 helix-turn-helix transcriptional regulator [Desulfovibrionaceae bacterium]